MNKKKEESVKNRAGNKNNVSNEKEFLFPLMIGIPDPNRSFRTLFFSSFSMIYFITFPRFYPCFSWVGIFAGSESFAGVGSKWVWRIVPKSAEHP